MRRKDESVGSASCSFVTNNSQCLVTIPTEILLSVTSLAAQVLLRLVVLQAGNVKEMAFVL